MEDTFPSSPITMAPGPHPLLHKLHCQQRSLRQISDQRLAQAGLLRTTLCNKNGNLAITTSTSHLISPSLVPIVRTPAPFGLESRCYRTNDSRRDKNTLRDLGFESLPPEIRLQIYRLLLMTPQSGIRYCICISCKRILVDECHVAYPLLYNKEGWHGGYRDTETGELKTHEINWPKHWTYPAILECNRLIHNEAMPILYGENAFAVSWPNPTKIVFHSWEISPEAIRMIKRARILSYNSRTLIFTQLPTYRHRFGGLKELTIQLAGPHPEWASLYFILVKFFSKIRLDKVCVMRAMKFVPVWDALNEKFYYQDFHSKYNDCPGEGDGDCHTEFFYNLSSPGDPIQALFGREDYIPPTPRHKGAMGHVSPPYLSGVDGVLRLTLSTSESVILSCPPLQRNACSRNLPLDGMVDEEDTRPTAIAGFKRLFNLPE
ncbi:hypothetical protein HYFRA_00008999 [Hymenoscyphus fraxineus]|uniref:F-box domain-containing protein n=1 Tax=Hymenoscyphus fraxineus TaxID=746836 RepID=A0A9N9KV94_9HELO|nr:hypothetical protein HYFRA_00008999 [Hymenoscyphus fraxineus]